MILKTSLKHGNYGYYHYRVHKHKTENLCSKEYTSLKKFLYNTVNNCPDKYFLEGPRSSVLKFKLDSQLKHESNRVELLARMGLESGYYDNAHMNVQMFMLAYDKKTIAIEIPIWLNPNEHEKYEELFNTTLTLTGHIDIIRIEDDGKIWIWDYKPNAHREKHADTQTYFYAVMLSKRTGIPLNKFMCGYFDVKNTYVFDPNKIKL